MLALNEVEIHLVDNNLESKVVLCAEPQIGWDDQDYDAFPLPEAGKLVSVEEGVAAASRVLTYRLGVLHRRPGLYQRINGGRLDHLRQPGAHQQHLLRRI